MKSQIAHAQKEKIQKNLGFQDYRFLFVFGFYYK